MKKIIFLLILFLLIFLAFSVIFNSLSRKKDESVLKVPSDSSFLNSQKVEVMAENLDTPWAIAFLPDESMLVTERAGRLRLVDKNGELAASPIATLSDVKQIGEGGLLGVTVHPEYSSNQFIYLYYTYSSQNNNTLNKVVRYKFDGVNLSEEKVIIDKIPGASFHNGGRIKFGPDGFLYITTGDSQNPSLAENKNSLAGKILRIKDDGTIPSDNPFKNAVYSFGHRNPQGIAWDSEGNFWETEHGPSGVIFPNCCQDEINKIEKGGNYGWPESVGKTVRPGTIGPVKESERETWAPGGAEFLNGSIFFGGLRGNTLYQAVTEGNNLSIKKYFENEFGRIREVIVGPDNFLYITTSNRDGRGTPKTGDDKILKINPQKL